MRLAILVVTAVLALSTVVRAQEEDDDPKAKPPATLKRATEKPKAKAEPKPETQAAKKPEPSTGTAAKKADPQAGTAAKKAAAPDEKKAIADESAKKPADEPRKTEKADKPKALPKLARAAQPVESEPAAEAPATSAAPAARSVRVRLVDGSTVVGSVRAEQAEALVVDCSLGQLSIPRARISTIAYDAAAGVGSKRAPVQMLDDDVPAPKKR